MAHVYFDRVRESTSTNGTADFTMSGAITGGFRTFASVMSNNDTTHYCAQNTSANEFEVGLGTYNSGVLARTAVLSNSLGTTNKINFTNNPQVFIDIPALGEPLSYNVAVSASGTTAGNATTLLHNFNVVSTVASGAGVILTSGRPTWIKNTGANPLKVYPHTGAAINSESTNVAVTVNVGVSVQYRPMTTAIWISF